MGYAAPLGNDVQFTFTATGYAAPAANALALDFQGSTLDVNITGSGGILVGGAADEEFFQPPVWNEVGAGGVLVGGSALFTYSYEWVEQGAGGVLVGGEADESFGGTVDFIGSGGILIGGTALEEASYVWSELGSGGVVVGGTAPNSFFQPSVWDEVGSGGVFVGGTALVSTMIGDVIGSGGVTVGGAALNSSYNVMEYIETGSGGVTIGGLAYNIKVVPAIDVSLPRPNVSMTNAGFTNYVFAQSTGKLWASIDAQNGAGINAPLTKMTADMTGLQGATGVISTSFFALGAELVGSEQVEDGILAYLPIVNPQISALAGAAGSVDARMPTLSVTIEGYTTVQGSVGVALPTLRPALNSLAGIVGSVNTLLNRIRADVVSVRGTSGTVAVILPTTDADMSGYTSVEGSISTALARMDAQIVGDVRPQHVTSLVANTITAALSEYENFGFTSFCEFDGGYYAAGPDGLYKIEIGDTDAGDEIAASFATGDLDFDSEYQKRIGDFYIAMRAKGDLTLKIGTDEGDPVEYTLSPYAVDTLKQRRVVTAKGARGKYWNFAVENTGGCDFEVDTMNIAVTPVARRI